MTNGDQTKFPTSVVMPDGSTYTGKQDSFPTTVRMPDGSTYAGDQGRFPILKGDQSNA